MIPVALADLRKQLLATQLALGSLERQLNTAATTLQRLTVQRAQVRSRMIALQNEIKRLEQVRESA